MKKVVLLFVATLFATMTFAQSNLPIDAKTEKICFRKVINTVGSQDEVFNRIYSNFMNSYYKSPSTILNQNDGRTMKGKHQFQLDNGDAVKSNVKRYSKSIPGSARASIFVRLTSMAANLEMIAASEPGRCGIDSITENLFASG